MSTTAQILCLLAGVASLMASLVITGLVRSLARRIGFVDRPDGGRKVQKEAVALGGGLAVALSALVGIGLAALGSSLGNGRLFEDFVNPLRVATLAGGVLIVALGLIDDAVGMKGRYKLLGQVLICGMLVSVGLRIDELVLFGQRFELGSFAIPFTMFWLLGAINAINLIDGIDGLAGSVGTVLCLTVASIMFLKGGDAFADLVIMLALAGSLVGFLRYNFAPASIYLGDAGSMLVGLMVGVTAIPGTAKSSVAISLMVPLAVWSIPILDSAAAIVRRKLTGRSVFAADRGHLHHSLVSRGWSVSQASVFVAVICAATGVSAVLSFALKNELIAVVTVVAIVVYLILTQTFGHIEFALVRHQLKQGEPSGSDAIDNRTGIHRTIQLRGSRGWDNLWAAVIESAEDYQLTRIKLSIDIASLNEDFYATWKASDPPRDADRAWQLSHPLIVEGKRVGSIDLSGHATDESLSTPAQISQVLDFVEPIEDDVRQIIDRIRVGRQEVKTGKSGRLPAATAGSLAAAEPEADSPVADSPVADSVAPS